MGVPPLDVPPPSATGAQVFAYPATVLFLDRLRRVRQRPVEVSEAATLGAWSTARRACRWRWSSPPPGAGY